MENLKEHQKLSSSEKLKSDSINFISAGIGCNCLVALYESGLLNIFLESESVCREKIKNCNNPICINSALITLEKCGIIKSDIQSLSLTEFGRSVSEYIGLITIFFDGYAGLVASQADIVKLEKAVNPEKLVKWAAVSSSSIQISEKMLAPIILEEIISLELFGTVCDLGCGHGTILSKICKRTGSCGLGFESHLQTVEEARELVDRNIGIELADITDLHGTWEDVTVLMQSFVFHDFNPEAVCIEIMNSYLKNFPNLEYFLYIDIMTPSVSKPELFPGFDYVHGLLGIPTRTYEETIEMFSRSAYKIYKEVPIRGLPNTFLWILSVRNKSFRG